MTELLFAAQTSALAPPGAQEIADLTLGDKTAAFASVLRPVRGQAKVDAERAPALGDSNESADKVRQFLSQRGEFVDHDDESS